MTTVLSFDCAQDDTIFFMHIILLAIGSIKTSSIAEGCNEYTRRIGHDASFEVIELPASKQKDPIKQSTEESDAILKKLEGMNGTVWVLDERGDNPSSEKFAELLETLSSRGEKIIFVLGGAYGHSNEVRERADRLIALSTMTFPHELCRLIALEQFYRALQIRKGTSYHH